MSKNLTTSDKEKFIEEANTVHNHKYDYSKVSFEAVLTSYDKVTIICPKHGEFNQRLGAHLGGHECAFCGIEKSAAARLLTKAQFLERALKIFGDKYNYSKVLYRTVMDPITIICDEHGEFTTTANGHLSGRGCRLCGIKRRAGKRCIGKEEFFERVRKVHGNFYSYDLTDYKALHGKIVIVCPKHGRFRQAAKEHVSGKRCRLCGIESQARSKTITTDEFVRRSREIHGTRFDYSEVDYVHGRQKVRIKCHHHGWFLQTPEGHLSGRGCKRCTHFVSRSETKWLDSIGLPNDDDHRNVTLKLGRQKIRVDGFDSSTNTIYEFNGDFWHGNPAIYSAGEWNDRTKSTHGDLYLKTVEREQLIKRHGYRLVTIWESEYLRRANLAG
ncbi:MAG TPA: hypothetical protein VI423_03325 [Paenisporosarcina sp.]|nr:hypothetical protein [Paenisporosarcina sp.]